MPVNDPRQTCTCIVACFIYTCCTNTVGCCSKAHSLTHTNNNLNQDVVHSFNRSAAWLLMPLQCLPYPQPRHIPRPTKMPKTCWSLNLVQRTKCSQIFVCKFEPVYIPSGIYIYISVFILHSSVQLLVIWELKNLHRFCKVLHQQKDYICIVITWLLVRKCEFTWFISEADTVRGKVAFWCFMWCSHK